MARYRLAVVVGFLFSLSAQAAQYATVRASQTNVIDAKRQVLEVLQSGTRVVVANEPQNGWFRARTPSGKVGFILARDLQVAGAPAAQQSAQPAAQGAAGRPGPGGKYEVRLLGGIDYIQPTTGLAITLLSNQALIALHFGGEFDVNINPTVFVPIRGEYLLKSASATSATVSSNVTFSAIPIYTGLGVRFGKGPKWFFRLTALGGYALAAGMNASETYNGTSWTTSLRTGALTFAGFLEASFRASPRVSISLEAGYRYLVTPSTVPTTTDTSLTTLPDGSTVDRTTATAVNLSGLAGSMNLIIHL